MVPFLLISAQPRVSPTTNRRGPAMSRRRDGGTREAGTFERGSQASRVNPIFFTRRHGGGDIDSRPASAVCTDGSLSGKLSHRSAILSVPHTPGVTERSEA